MSSRVFFKQLILTPFQTSIDGQTAVLLVLTKCKISLLDRMFFNSNTEKLSRDNLLEINECSFNWFKVNVHRPVT